MRIHTYPILSTTLIPHFSLQLPSQTGCCFLGEGYYSCLLATRGVVWALIPAALIQSDSDRRIKMQILACALLAILSLPFSLCGMLRGQELERWPWGWIFKWPPDFPTERRQQQPQPGFHLHSSLSPFTAYQQWLTQLSTIPKTIHATFNSNNKPPTYINHTVVSWKRPIQKTYSIIQKGIKS